LHKNSTNTGDRPEHVWFSGRGLFWHLWCIRTQRSEWPTVITTSLNNNKCYKFVNVGFRSYNPRPVALIPNLRYRPTCETHKRESKIRKNKMDDSFTLLRQR